MENKFIYGSKIKLVVFMMLFFINSLLIGYSQEIKNIQESELINRCIEQLKDKDPKVRLKAVATLGMLGSNEAIRSLSKILEEDEDSRVREAATWALGTIGDDEVVEPLIKAFQDKDNHVREAAILGISKLGEPVVNILIKKLKDKNEYTRTCVAEALGNIGSIQMVDVLIEILEDESWRVRANAVEALGKIRDKKTTLLLIEKLKDNEIFVRRETTKALGKIEDDRAVEPLITAFNSEREDCTVCSNVIKALGDIGSPQGVDFLITEALKKSRQIKTRLSSCWGYQKEAIEALGKIGDKKAVEPLIRLLKHEDWHILEEVVRSLGMIGDTRAAEPVIEMLKRESKDWTIREVRDDAADVLTKMGRPIIDLLIKTLKDENPYARMAAVEALGRIGDIRAVKPIIEMIKKEPGGPPLYGQVQDEAIEALEKIGDKRAIRVLIDLLKGENIGRIREKAHKLLKKFTGENYGCWYEDWLQWWEREGKVKYFE